MPRSAKGKSKSIVPAERVERGILLIRGHRIMIDSDLAELYGVTTKPLNQAVKPQRRKVSVRLGLPAPRAREDAGGHKL